MASQNPLSGSYKWEIKKFSRLTHKKYYSNVFTIGSYKWILIYPKGIVDGSVYLGIYLDVPDAASLPIGWRREAYFTLTVVNQNDGSFSIRKDHVHTFYSREADWGYASFMPRSDLHNRRKGFLVNDTLIVKAEVDVLSETVRPGPPHVAPPIDALRVMETNHPPNTARQATDSHGVTGTDRFDSFFTKLEEFMTTKTKEGSSSNDVCNNQMDDLLSGSPSLEEVEKAKQSLKECLSDLFKLNVKDRLAAALLTLTRAEVGLSSDQQKSIGTFWENFDDFVSDFLMFEQDNSDFELQKLTRDRMFSAMKKNHEIHLSNKQLLEALTEEEKELEKRMEEVKSSKEKLISDWESLMAKSEETKSKYTAQEKKLAVAEENKRIAEERMSRSTAAWFSLKAQFTEIKPEPSFMHEHHKTTLVPMSQKAPAESDQGTKYPNVKSSLYHSLNSQIVNFRSLERPKLDDFVLELSKLDNYDEVVARVASQVGVDDPSKIRLTSHNCHSELPKLFPIKYRGVQNLVDMLVHYNQTSNILYYEVLDIPLPELQGLKSLKLTFHHASNSQVVIHNIRLPKQSTVGDMLNELKKKVVLSHPNAELRLLEVLYHKIYKIFSPNDKIENIGDRYLTLRAEEIPEEEKNLGPGELIIHAYHFRKKTAQNQTRVQNFGEPLLLVIREHETLGEVKIRLQKKMQVSGEDFSKWRFVFVSMGRPEYLDDFVILLHHFQRQDPFGAWEQYLGMEHPEDAQ